MKRRYIAVGIIRQCYAIAFCVCTASVMAPISINVPGSNLGPKLFPVRTKRGATMCGDRRSQHPKLNCDCEARSRLQDRRPAAVPDHSEGARIYARSALAIRDPRGLAHGWTVGEGARGLVGVRGRVKGVWKVDECWQMIVIHYGLLRMFEVRVSTSKGKSV